MRSGARLVPALEPGPSELRDQAVANVPHHRPAVGHMLLALSVWLPSLWYSVGVLNKNGTDHNVFRGRQNNDTPKWVVSFWFPKPNQRDPQEEAFSGGAA